MKNLRVLLSWLILTLLGLGYIAYEVSYDSGTTSQLATKLDAQPVRLLALILLVASVVLGIVKDRDEVATP